jgi:hypothetical protein
MTAANSEPSVFDFTDLEADERAVREGEAAADAGQVVSHAEVSAWLATWGTTDEKPAPGNFNNSRLGASFPQNGRNTECGRS